MSMNYTFHLNNLRRSKTDSKYTISGKTIGDFSFIDHNFNIVSEKNLKRINKESKEAKKYRENLQLMWLLKT